MNVTIQFSAGNLLSCKPMRFKLVQYLFHWRCRDEMPSGIGPWPLIAESVSKTLGSFTYLKLLSFCDDINIVLFIKMIFILRKKGLYTLATALYCMKNHPDL